MQLTPEQVKGRIKNVGIIAEILLFCTTLCFEALT